MNAVVKSSLDDGAKWHLVRLVLLTTYSIYIERLDPSELELVQTVYFEGYVLVK